MITQNNVTIKTQFHENGKVQGRFYVCPVRQFDGEYEYHRDPADGPAYETFHESGQVHYRGFYVGGKRHRPTADGAAHQIFNEDGKLNFQGFWENGNLHRPVADGPALEWFDENGVSTNKEYWLDGVHVFPPCSQPAAPADCIAGTTIEIAGKKYKLIAE